jgi:PAS domain S-box-containing protein
VPDRYRQLFLTLADAVFLVDAAGSIREANTAATWLLGCPAEEVRGHNFREFLAPDSLERFNAQWQTLHSYERLEFETKCVTAARATVDVLLDVSQLPADEAAGEGKETYLVMARQAAPRDLLQRELVLARRSVERGSADS